MIELLALVPLGVAAVYDARRGKVPDWIWLASIPLAVTVAAVQARAHEPVAILVASVFALLFSWAAIHMWFLGQQGGADAKAIAVMAVMGAWPVHAWQLPLAADALLFALMAVPLFISLHAKVTGRRLERVRFLPFLAVAYAGAWWLGDPFPSLARMVLG